MATPLLERSQSELMFNMDWNMKQSKAEWLPDGGVPLNTVCVTDALLGSKQPSMTNRDRGPALTVSSVPVLYILLILQRGATPGSDCMKIH